MRSRSHALCQNLLHTKHQKLNHFKLLLAQNSIFEKKMPMYHIKNITISLVKACVRYNIG